MMFEVPYFQINLMKFGYHGEAKAIFSIFQWYYIPFTSFYHWIGLRENLQENPIFNGIIYGFL